jgi:hypothetical protein
MHKWTFTHGSCSEKIFTIHQDAGLAVLIEEFEYYLKACGFELNGTIGIIKGDEQDEN